jgi:hypothetical protein
MIAAFFLRSNPFYVIHLEDFRAFCYRWHVKPVVRGVTVQMESDHSPYTSRPPGGKVWTRGVPAKFVEELMPHIPEACKVVFFGYSFNHPRFVIQPHIVTEEAWDLGDPRVLVMSDRFDPLDLIASMQAPVEYAG